MPGVLQSVRMYGAVAIIAETFWQAKKAIDELAARIHLARGETLDR